MIFILGFGIGIIVGGVVAALITWGITMSGR